MTVIIRRASIYDQGQILNLLEKWFNEVNFVFLPGFCGSTGVWIADLIARQLVLIGEYKGKIIGALGLKLSNFPWNNEVKILSNDFLMTDKEYRDTGIANKLIKAAKDFAKESKMILAIGHITGKDAELKNKFLQISGFGYAGGNFFYYEV